VKVMHFAHTGQAGEIGFGGVAINSFENGIER
jgi:hypothetical protein